MDPHTKDVIDVASKLISSLGFVVAAVALCFNWCVRRQDLRWRMATAARDTFSDIHKNEFAVAALEMIDCMRWQETCTALVRRGISGTITAEMVEHALRTEPHPTSGAASAEQVKKAEQGRIYVRRCFDWLLYYMDRVAYQANVGFLLPDDFAAPLAPYANFVSDHWEYFGKLATKQNYVSLPTQIVRFSKFAPDDGRDAPNAKGAV